MATMEIKTMNSSEILKILSLHEVHFFVPFHELEAPISSIRCFPETRAELGKRGA